MKRLSKSYGCATGRWIYARLRTERNPAHGRHLQHDREEYLPLLFKDEVKNYLFRCSVNATTFLRRLEAEGICVQNAV